MSKSFSAFTTDLDRIPGLRDRLELEAAAAFNFRGHVTVTVSGDVTTITGTAA